MSERSTTSEILLCETKQFVQACVRVQRLRFQFNERKSAQAVAFLLRRAGTAGLSKGFLVKLLYLADCRQLARVGAPITGDQPSALPQGPVLSHILNLFNGSTPSSFWVTHFAPADSRHMVQLLSDPGSDLLSEAEKKSLSVAFDRYKKFTWAQLVDALHERKEWIKHNPGRSSKVIPFESILEAEGRDAAFIKSLADQAAETDALQKMFA